jgi:DNA-binding response OmpR family regulator
MTHEAHIPASILIVDDIPANLNVLSTLLTQQGYKVRPANSGEVALVVAKNATIDLILLDVQMPGMNGFAVCRELKSWPSTQAIPVIFISALDEALDKVEAFEVGGADYITKPFQILEVLARVEHQLELYRQRRQIAIASTIADQLQATSARLTANLAILEQPSASLPAELLADIRLQTQSIAANAAELAQLVRTSTDRRMKPSSE